VLATLAYRYTAELAGTVTCYPLPAGFTDTWQSIADATARRRLPYASLATALTAATGDVVRLWLGRQSGPDRETLLLSRAPIDPWLLSRATAAWESAVRDCPADSLATLIEKSEPEQRQVAAGLRNNGGTADPDGWVYDVAAWEACRRLAASPLPLGDRTVLLRPDTNAQLVAWDAPIIAHRRDGSTAHALHVIKARLVTLPGVAEPVLVLSASVSRLVDHWAAAKNAWVDHDGAAALLLLPVRKARHEGGWRTFWDGHAASVTQALDVHPLDDPTEDALAGSPGAVRAFLAKSQRHPIGKGPGMRFLDLLGVAADASLGDDLRLNFASTRLRIGTPRRGAPSPAPVASALRSEAREPLAIVCLYDTEATRARMQAAMGRICATDGFVAPDGVAASLLEDTASVTFIRVASAALAPGPSSARNPVVDALALLETPQPATLAVLCPTDPTPFAASTPRSEQLPATEDPKPQLRRLLAARGAVTQFLAPPASRSELSDVDHPADAAVRDLFRSCGVVDDRLGRIAARAPALVQSALVGIHVRRQTTTPGSRHHVVTLAAALVGDRPDVPWTLLGYHPTCGWAPYPRALAALHSSPHALPASGAADAYAAIRRYVTAALDQLAARTPLPIITFVDAMPGRQIWSGLANRTLGDGALPAPSARSAAVVRVNTDMRELPRPIRLEGGRRRSNGAPSTTTGIFRLPESSAEGWYLASRSRLAESGAAARLGQHLTRYAVADDARRSRRLGDDWHSMTMREFLVVHAAGLDSEMLAVAAVRLCQQATHWDGRTVKPVPLHLAVLADKDHPDYRAETIGDPGGDPVEESDGPPEP
jgi:hypothetical protein